MFHILPTKIPVRSPQLLHNSDPASASRHQRKLNNLQNPTGTSRSSVKNLLMFRSPKQPSLRRLRCLMPTGRLSRTQNRNLKGVVAVFMMRVTLKDLLVKRHCVKRQSLLGICSLTSPRIHTVTFVKEQKCSSLPQELSVGPQESKLKSLVITSLLTSLSLETKKKLELMMNEVHWL